MTEQERRDLAEYRELTAKISGTATQQTADFLEFLTFAAVRLELGEPASKVWAIWQNKKESARRKRSYCGAWADTTPQS